MTADDLPISKLRSRRRTSRETSRDKHPSHMAWLLTQPCIVTGETGVVRHHLQHAQPSASSMKSGDRHAVPIVNRLHVEIHATGAREADWWAARGIDALAVARALFALSIVAGRVTATPEARREAQQIAQSWAAFSGG